MASPSITRRSRKRIRWMPPRKRCLRGIAAWRIKKMQAVLTEPTNLEKSNDSPFWLDRTEYAWEPHYFQTDAGRIHWIEAGAGDPIIFVHGTPTWSFEWRHLLKHFAATHRVLALDHLG